MNILKLAKHLKEFTLHEINMIAECDVENELKHLLNSHNIVFQQGVYKYVENNDIPQIEIISKPKDKFVPKNFEEAAKYFLKNYAFVNCTTSSAKTYESLLKAHIIPFLGKKKLKNISTKDIKSLYEICKCRCVAPRRTKDVLKLLNHVLKYCYNEGFMPKSCVFQIYWATNSIKVNRINFEGD